LAAIHQQATILDWLLDFFPDAEWQELKDGNGHGWWYEMVF
jgi:hypothetical protein